jgi:hypothetical protein
VIVEFDLLGTNLGEFYGFPPTGKAFRVPIIAVFFFEGDRIVNERVYFDSASLVTQIGRGSAGPGQRSVKVHHRCEPCTPPRSCLRVPCLLVGNRQRFGPLDAGFGIDDCAEPKARGSSVPTRQFRSTEAMPAPRRLGFDAGCSTHHPHRVYDLSVALQTSRNSALPLPAVAAFARPAAGR